MAIEPLNPNGIFAPTTYSQVTVARGSRMIFLSGQVATDEQGNVIGKGDLAAQTEQVYRNIGAALRGAGATFQDVARLNAYVVGWTPDKMDQLIAGAMRAAADIGFDPQRAITLVGVQALASPDLLIEVEAIAVAD